MSLDPREVARLREEFELERDMEERRAKIERFGAPCLLGPVCFVCNKPITPNANGMWSHVAEEGCPRVVVSIEDVSEVAR